MSQQEHRTRKKSIHVLRNDFDDISTELQDILAIDSATINSCDELKQHGRQLKEMYQKYSDISRAFSKELLNKGSIENSSNVHSTRHAMYREFNEKFEIIQKLLHNLNEEELSVYNKDNTCSIASESSLSCCNDNNLFQKKIMVVTTMMYFFLIMRVNMKTVRDYLRIKNS